MAFAVIGGFVLAQFFIAPQLILDRTQTVMSVIRSHENDIILHKTRAVRDELLKAGLISTDQQFEHFSFSDLNNVRTRISRCAFVLPTACVGKNESIFFDSHSDKSPQDNFRFAVVLGSDLTGTPSVLFLWETLVAVFTSIAFLLLWRSIAKKERHLLARLSVASSAFERTRHMLSGANSTEDEFDAFGRSAEDLVKVVEDYKARFEKKARLEQLGLTIGRVSHDLKAPLNEADRFLQFLLDSEHRPEHEEAIKSLLGRIRSSKSALKEALRETKIASLAREELSFSNLLAGVVARTRENPKLQFLSLSILIDGEYKSIVDRQKIETALLNLLENSADEKQDAKVSIAVTRVERGKALISYHDNGGGIAEDLLEKIFEPLVSFKATGTGFGLSSTREILSQHDGQILARPWKGGAKFEIQLPCIEVANA
jgi:signal transduction histidine kinase